MTTQTSFRFTALEPCIKAKVGTLLTTEYVSSAHHEASVYPPYFAQVSAKGKNEM